jgi:hypothetical protein
MCKFTKNHAYKPYIFVSISKLSRKLNQNPFLCIVIVGAVNFRPLIRLRGKKYKNTQKGAEKMFKKFVSVCLVMLVILSQVPFGIFAEETAVETAVEETVSETADWGYEVNSNGGITLTEYKGNDTEVIIDN